MVLCGITGGMKGKDKVKAEALYEWLKARQPETHEVLHGVILAPSVEGPSEFLVKVGAKRDDETNANTKGPSEAKRDETSVNIKRTSEAKVNEASMDDIVEGPSEAQRNETNVAIVRGTDALALLGGLGQVFRWLAPM